MSAPYCPLPPCQRIFKNRNNLREHSKVHLPLIYKCTESACDLRFALRGSLLLHLESGNCVSNSINRATIIFLAEQMDRFNVVTIPGTSDYYRSSRDGELILGRDWLWDPYGGSICAHCQKWFPTPKAVSDHLRSGVHEEPRFRCNGRDRMGRYCGQQFVVLSGLAQHLESTACSWPRGVQAIDNFIQGARTYTFVDI